MHKIRYRIFGILSLFGIYFATQGNIDWCKVHLYITWESWSRHHNYWHTSPTLLKCSPRNNIDNGLRAICKYALEVWLLWIHKSFLYIIHIYYSDDLNSGFTDSLRVIIIPIYFMHDSDHNHVHEWSILYIY